MWQDLIAWEQEVLAGMVAANLAELFSNLEVRKGIQQAGLEAAGAAIGELQRRLSAPKVARQKSKRAVLERPANSRGPQEGIREGVGI